MRLSHLTSATVAALVGLAGTLAVVLAAAEAVGATPAQTTSWVTGIFVAMALCSGLLSVWHRTPIIVAYSTPGAAVIAATAGSVSMSAAVGAFLLAGGLIVLTALIGPLKRLIEAIPMPVASGMLAGVLLPFVVDMAKAVPAAPAMVLPLAAVFLVVRLWSPALAMVAVIVVAIAIALIGGALVRELGDIRLSRLEWIEPAFDWPVLIGLGVPLYLVTMASQNLPGAAVLRAHGYAVPMQSSLAVTGLASLAIAPFGGHTVNLAAITAAICMGPDTHPDPARRWPAGIAYLLVYAALAAAGASLVALFQAFPGPLVKAIAGLGLLASLTGAMTGAVADSEHRIAAVTTFVVTASGIAIAGIGAAFWGLVAGLVVLAVDRLAARQPS